MKFLRFVLVLLLCSANALCATRPSQATRLDVFDSFRALDAKFTTLDNQYHDLAKTIEKRSSTKANRNWLRLLRQMRGTTAKISGLGYRLYAEERKSRRQFGSQMFLHLHRQAGMLRTRLTEANHASSNSERRRDSVRIQKAMLDLVLQYQAISGGYGALHCNAGAWSCGVPKRQPRTVGYPQLGTKWICVQHSQTCKGVLGPRTPALASQPLTADTMTR
jgi:hypothetical protein